MENIKEVLWSNLSVISYVYAMYTSSRSFIVFTQTPALLTHNENDEVTTARSRLFVLHGLNLAIRWGYLFFYLIARKLTLTEVRDGPGSYLQSYVYGLWEMKQVRVKNT